MYRFRIPGAALAGALLVSTPALAFGPPILVSNFPCNCAGNFTSMRGVAAASDGYIYQVDGLKLHKFDSNGVRISTQTLPMTLRDIAAGPGFLVAVEATKVWKLTLPALGQSTWGTAGSGVGQFQQANGVACDAAGNIYVVDGVNNRMTKYNSSGTLLSSFTSYSGGSLTAPRAIAIDSDGDIWISQTSGPDMLRFNSSYAYQQTIPRVTSNPVMGLVVDTDHNLIAAAAPTNHASTEQLIKYYVDFPGFWDPLDTSVHGGDVTQASDGKVYVEDQGTLRIHKFRPCAAPTMTQPILSLLTVILGNYTTAVAHFTGDPPLVYRWEKGYTPVDDGPEYAGQGDSALNIYATSTAVEGTYHCMVRNLCDAVYANEFYVRVCTPVAITLQPQSTTAAPGSLVIFQSAATGTNDGPYPITLSYQWRRNGAPLSDNSHYSGTHTPTLSINNVSAADQADYRVEVSNACSAANSKTAGLVVGECFNLAEVQAISLDSLGGGIFEDEPVAMVAADMETDGWTDLLVSGQQSKRVFRIRNQGGGLMSQAAPVTPTPQFPHETYLAAADLNEDGRQDVLQYGYSGGNSYVGVTLSPAYNLTTHYYVPGPPAGLVTADFDGDGHQDVGLLTEWPQHFNYDAVDDTTAAVWWRRGLGTGGFAPGGWQGLDDLGFDNEGTDSFFGLVKGRFGYGGLGVAYGRNEPALNRTTTFAMDALPPQLFSRFQQIMSYPQTLLPGSRMIAADLLHLSYDLLVVSGAGRLIVSRNEIGNNTGFWDLGTAGSGGEVSIASGDFNGDHNIDIATVEQGSNLIRIFWGTGSSAFGYPHTDYEVNLISGPINATYPVWQALAAADLNRDGRDDLIVTGQNPSNYTATHQVRIFRIPCGVAAAPLPPVTPAGTRNLAAAPAVFRSRTSVSFSLATPGRVELAVYDATGRRVSRLWDGKLEGGDHSLEWNGSTLAGGAAPSGVYFVRLRAGGRDAVARVVKLR